MNDTWQELLGRIVVYILVFFLNAWIVQTAWNNLEFGTSITYWQAIGLLIMCDVLFKSNITIRKKINE
jgi:hypothetical protein